MWYIHQLLGLRDFWFWEKTVLTKFDFNLLNLLTWSHIFTYCTFYSMFVRVRWGTGTFWKVMLVTFVQQCTTWFSVLQVTKNCVGEWLTFEQIVHESHSPQFPSTGQLSSLQLLLSTPAPVQGFPKPVGAGLSHDRDLIFTISSVIPGPARYYLPENR